MSQTPPGWYDDGQHPGQVRYWDGGQWTEHFAPSDPASVAPVATAPVAASTAPSAPPQGARRLGTGAVVGIVAGAAVVLAGALVGVLAATGAFGGATAPSPGPVAETGQTPAVSPSASPTPTPTPEPIAEWAAWTSPDGKVSLELPEGWTVDVEERTVDDGLGSIVANYTVRDPDGVPRLRQGNGAMGLGGPGCGVALPPSPYWALGAVPTDAPPSGFILFDAVDSAAGVIASFGYASEVPAVLEACEPPAWRFFQTAAYVGQSSWGALSPLSAPVDAVYGTPEYDAVPRDPAYPSNVIDFDSMADAEAFVVTEEYATLLRILLSLRFNV